MSRNTVARVIEVMKSLRVTPLDREGIATGMGCSKSIVDGDVSELLELGVLEVVKLPPKRPGATGKPGHEREGLILSKHWGGVGAQGVTT